MEAEAEESSPGSKQLTNDEIVILCIGFLLAGYETTSNVLAFTSYLLAMNPDKQDKLIQEINDYYEDHKVIGCIVPIVIHYALGVFFV